MDDLNSKNSDQEQNSDFVDDDSFEKDDLFKFHLNSSEICIYYSQLTKYSEHIREEYNFSDVKNLLAQEIDKLQEESQLLPESVNFFFELLQQNYNINENLTLTYIQCNDLLQISESLKVRKLSYKIKQYIKSRQIDVDFVIEMFPIPFDSLWWFNSAVPVSTTSNHNLLLDLR